MEKRELPLKRLSATILIVYIVMLSFCCPVARAAQEEKKDEELKLYSQSAVLIDGGSGRVLYGKNEGLQRPMASTTKIMTCILALELGDLSDQVTASAYAAAQPKVHLGVRKGEIYYLKDLLYSLMLESHNDAAVMIAEHIGGSVAGFADWMNEKARSLGCEDTWFITPNGLDAQETDEEGNVKIHSTTAVDLARIMRYCIEESPKSQEFLEITRTQNYAFTELEGKRSFSCVNHNAFLTMMSGALSGKTGFTGGAGYSYVGALERDGKTFIIALLGCGWPPHKTYKWADARTLIQYGLDHYEYRDVWKPAQFLPIPVKNGIPENGEVWKDAQVEVGIELSEEEQSFPILLRKEEEVQVRYHIEPYISAPVEPGQRVGYMEYLLDDQVIRTDPIVTMEGVEKLTWSWCLNRIAEQFLFVSPGNAPEVNAPEV